MKGKGKGKGQGIGQGTTRALVFGVGLMLVARPVWALCPNCLGQSSTLGAALRLVGIFLLVPPAIFFAVAIAIRKLSRAR
jgi:hypothetical protein